MRSRVSRNALFSLREIDRRPSSLRWSPSCAKRCRGPSITSSWGPDTFRTSRILPTTWRDCRSSWPARDRWPRRRFGGSVCVDKERDEMTIDAALDVLDPAHADFESRRMAFNGMIDRQPAYIVRCSTVDDVRGAVRFARDKGLP